MADYTNNLDLYKPNRNDDVEVDTSLSSNFEKIDEEVTKNKNETAAHKADGTHNNVEATNTNDATSVTDAPLKSAGGFAVSKQSYFGDTQNLDFSGVILKAPRFLKAIYNSDMVDSLDDGQQIRIRFNTTSHNKMIHLQTVFDGSADTGQNERGSIDKSFSIYHFYSGGSGQVSDLETHTGIIRNFADSEVFVENADDYHFDLILQHPAEHTRIIKTWFLNIDLYSSKGSLDVDFIRVENV